MGFLSTITRIGEGIATGGLSELAQGGSGSVIGQLTGASSAAAANATNVQLANQANAFSAQQAQKQMDFQERMSNTAHQREVQDLEKAGLNPILSANAGASSPGGAAGSPSLATVQPVPTTLQGLFSTARDVLGTYASLKGASASATSADAALQNAKTNAARAGADIPLAQAQLPKQQLEANLFGMLNKLIGRISNSAKSLVKPWSADDERTLGPTMLQPGQ